MSEHRQRIIEELIFAGKAGAFDVATILHLDPYDVFDELEAMKAEGVVRVGTWESLDDDGDEYDGEYIQLARSRDCEPEHFVNWQYCGGPISRAFAETA